MKAIIKRSGFAGLKFRFFLIGDNGEEISRSQRYTQKHNAVEVLIKYFPNFKIEDRSYLKRSPK